MFNYKLESDDIAGIFNYIIFNDENPCFIINFNQKICMVKYYDWGKNLIYSEQNDTFSIRQLVKIFNGENDEFLKQIEKETNYEKY